MLHVPSFSSNLQHWTLPSVTTAATLTAWGRGAGVEGWGVAEGDRGGWAVEAGRAADGAGDSKIVPTATRFNVAKKAS